MNDRLRLNLKALRPKSFGFFFRKGLGCRSIGCQSSLTTSNSSSSWKDAPIILFFLTIPLHWATHIDWGNSNPVHALRSSAILQGPVKPRNAKKSTTVMRIASPRSPRRYFASILTLSLRGVLSPLSPVSHAVARTSAPATVAAVEYAVSFVVQD